MKSTKRDERRGGKHIPTHDDEIEMEVVFFLLFRISFSHSFVRTFFLLSFLQASSSSLLDVGIEIQQKKREFEGLKPLSSHADDISYQKSSNIIHDFLLILTLNEDSSRRQFALQNCDFSEFSFYTEIFS